MVIIMKIDWVTFISVLRCALWPASLDCAFEISDFVQKQAKKRKCVMCKVPASLGLRHGLHLSQIMGM